jgi:hypothetical protein
MNIPKTFSDSKLASLFKSKEDAEINTLLPKFLMKDLQEESYIANFSNYDEIQFNTQNHYIHSKCDVKECEREKFRENYKFSSSNNVRNFVRENKHQAYTKFQNFYKPGLSKQETNYREASTNYGTYNSYNSNDTDNMSILEDLNNFLSLKPVPKRINSNVDVKKIKSKSSLFYNNDKEEICEDFENIQELLASINCELWTYARTQKGSRNLQKLLNKIVPDELDIILEKVKGQFAELMTDIYGNYFCQKLIQCCSAEQRMFMLKHVIIDNIDYERLYDDLL